MCGEKRIEAIVSSFAPIEIVYCEVSLGLSIQASMDLADTVQL